MRLGVELRHLLVSSTRRVFPTRVREHLEMIRYCGLPNPVRMVRPYSLLSNLNLLFLQELARRLDEWNVPGDFVECGVCRGGSGALLGYEAVKSKHSRRVWLYDAFAGMPPASALDDERSKSLEGKHVGSEKQTRRLLRRLRVPEDHFRITAGWFDDTLPSADRVRNDTAQPNRPRRLLLSEATEINMLRLRS